jgi:heme/copper-type cytochrome/quinol oxidase subunit 2
MSGRIHTFILSVLIFSKAMVFGASTAEPSTIAETDKKEIALLVAVAFPLLLRLIPESPRTHYITLKAKKFGYSPSRIVVNKGDTIVLKTTSLDVTHGFLLD